MNVKSVLFLLSIALLPSIAKSADFFWIGGTGEWDDVGHWATSSGGTTIHFGIPSANDDVFFDTNSFVAATDEVDLLRLAVQCRSLTVNTTLAATFVGSGTFIISGNLDLAAGINWNYRGRVEFRPSFATTTINGRDHSIANTVYFVGTTSTGWEIQSNLRAENSITTTPSQINFAGGIDVIANTITIETDGRSDYSNLTFRPGQSMRIIAAPSEAASLSSCDVKFSGTSADIQVGGIIQFPFRSIWANSVSNASFRISSRSSTIRTTELIADTLLVGKNGDYQLDLSLGYFQVEKGSTQKFLRGNRLEVAAMKAIGECLKPIFFEGRNASEFVADASALLQLEHIHVDDIPASGGSTWGATESSGTGLISGWNFSTGFGEDRYWIGDSGSWDDTAHWSHTSGGAGGACPPKAGNNAIFDASSFNSSAQQVEIPEGNWAIKSLDCSAISQDFTLIELRSASVIIYGSMILSPRVTWTGSQLPNLVTFKGPATGRTILTHGRTDQLSLSFIGTGGGWTILDSLSVGGQLNHSGGSLFTKGHPIACRAFRQGVTFPSFLDLEASRIHIRPGDTRFYSGTPYVSFRASLTKDASIFIEEENSSTTVDFGSNSSASQNQIDRIISLAPVDLRASDTLEANLIDLRKSSRLRITGVLDSLLLHAGAGYTFGSSSRTSGITVDHISITGTCLDPIILNSTVDYHLSSTNPQQGDFLQIQNIDAVGGPWTATESSDLGSNTGWLFATPPLGRTLYWAGGTGTWFDPSHWSETDGGPTGACPPTRLDDVFFEVGSLANGDTVYLSQTTAYNSTTSLSPECKTLDARGLTGAGARFAGRELFVYGSFYNPVGADFTLRDLYLRDTLPSAEILIQGQAPQDIQLQEKGTYTAIADINATGLDIEIRKGTFRTDGYTMEVSEFDISGNTNSIATLDLGDSEVKLYNSLFALSMSSTGSIIRSNNAWIRYDRPTVYIRCNESTGGVNMEFPSGGNARLVVSSRIGQGDFTTLNFRGSGLITGPIAADSLILTKGLPFTINNRVTEDLTIREYFYAVGSACSPIPMSTSSGATVNASIQFENAAISAMDYVRIDRIDAKGPGQPLAGRNSVNVANKSLGWQYETVSSVQSLDRFFLGPDLAICDSIPALISPNVPPSFVATYTWQDSSVNRDFQPSTPGAYFLDVIFEEGTCQLRDSIIITSPAYDLNQDLLINGCGATEVRLDVPEPTANGYRWIVESGTINNSDPNGIDVAVPGVYFLEQTVGACMDSTRYEVDAGSTVTKDSLIQFCGTTTLVTSLSSYTITQDTILSETFSLPSGCDSVIQFTVDVLDMSFSDSLITGCAPVSFRSGSGTNYTVFQDSLIEERFTAFTGCDSVRQYSVQVIGQPVATQFSQTFCSPDTLVTPTNSYHVSNDTTIIEQLSTLTGCDSIVTWTVLITRDSIRASSNQTWCESGALTTPLANYPITTDTTITETYRSFIGCDSIHTYNIYIQEVQNSSQAINWCGPSTLTTNLDTYFISTDTTFAEVYTSYLGCDSIRNYSVIINDTIRTDTSITFCEPTLLVTAQNNFTAIVDTSFSETFTSSTGCDSIHTYNIQFELVPTTTSTLTWCTSDTLRTSITEYYIYQDSSFSEIFTSYLGCDSILIYNVTVLPEIRTDTVITGCDSLSLTTSLGSHIFNQDTILIEKYSSIQGCDSTRSYSISINESINTTQEIRWCAPSTLTTDIGTYTISADSSFTEAYVSFSGCDSLRTYDIIISDTIHTDTSIVFCEPTVFITAQNNLTIEADTIFSETYSSAVGCDSIRTYHLQFEIVPATQSELLWCSPDTLHTSLDTYFITQDSSITEIFSSYLGCDSSHTYFITVLPPIRIDTLLTGCDSLVFSTSLSNFSFNQDTVFTEMYASSQGCDSIRNYTVRLSKSEPIASLVDAHELSCFRQNDGQINLWDPIDTTNLTWILDSNALGNLRNATGLAAGEYALSLTYGEGCSGDTIVSLTEPPAIAIDLPDSIQAAVGQNFSIYEQPSGGTFPYLFRWTANSGVFQSPCPRCPALDFEAISAGWIIAEIQDATGCMLTDSIWLDVPEPEDFYLPNAFSPNNDGVNDILQIYGIPDITVEDVKVFNRWGNLTYIGLETAKPLIANIWNGQDAKPGIYLVLFTITWSNGRKEVVTREVSLMK